MTARGPARSVLRTPRSSFAALATSTSIFRVATPADPAVMTAALVNLTDCDAHELSASRLDRCTPAIRPHPPLCGLQETEREHELQRRPSLDHADSACAGYPRHRPSGQPLESRLTALPSARHANSSRASRCLSPGPAPTPLAGEGRRGMANRRPHVECPGAPWVARPGLLICFRRAARVFGPTTPSAVSPSAAWNAFTPFSVRGPYLPSMAPGL